MIEFARGSFDRDHTTDGIAGMIRNLAALMEKAVAWSSEAQEQLIEVAREIEATQGGIYQASPEELNAINEADASGLATDQEVRAVLEKFRQR